MWRLRKGNRFHERTLSKIYIMQIINSRQKLVIRTDVICSYSWEQVSEDVWSKIRGAQKRRVLYKRTMDSQKSLICVIVKVFFLYHRISRRYDRHWTRSDKKTSFWSDNDRYWQAQSASWTNTRKVSRTFDAHIHCHHYLKKESWVIDSRVNTINQVFTDKFHQRVLTFHSKAKGMQISYH